MIKQKQYPLLPSLLCVVVLTGCEDGSLLTAIKNGDRAEATRLVEQGGKMNLQDREGNTALHLAIEASDYVLFIDLLKHGADPNICNKRGSSVVHTAAKQEDPFWLTEVLSHGGNVNQDNTGNPFVQNDTPIFYAIQGKQNANAILLINAGADVKHVNSRGSTPLLEAVQSGLYDVAIALINAGADPKVLGDSTVSNYFDEEFASIVKLSGKKLVDYQNLKALLHEKGRF